jgi:hypothetical protein
MIRFVRNLRRVQHPQELIGRWVFEFRLSAQRWEWPEEYCLVFGIYKVKASVPEGCYLVCDDNIKGFRFDFRFRRARS